MLALPAADDAVQLATQPVTGPQHLPAVMARAHLHGPIIASAIPAWAFWGANLPAAISYGLPPSVRGYDTIVVNPDACGHPIDAATRALIQLNLRIGSLHQIYHDPKMTVYATQQVLQAPNPAQVAAHPTGDPSSGC